MILTDFRPSSTVMGPKVLGEVSKRSQTLSLHGGLRLSADLLDPPMHMPQGQE
jgi:hypothetical protein